MDIIVSNSSDKPIYEQIAAQMRDAVLTGKLTEGDKLPSIRQLATDLRISVITTKRAYQELESQGFITTVQGKGCFVTGGNTELLKEEKLRRVEAALSQAVEEAAGAGITPEEFHAMLDTLMEE